MASQKVLTDDDFLTDVDFDDSPTLSDKDFMDESQEPSLAKKFASGVSNVVNQAIEGPGRDLAEGALKGNIAVSRPSASVLEAVGVPDEYNLPKRIIQSAEELRRNLPEPKSAGAAKAINELIAEAPGITAEFLQGGAVMRGAGVTGMMAKTITGKSLIPAAELAVTRAMEELKEGFPEALDAAKEGALIGMAFPVALKGLGLIKQGLKSGAKKVIELSTGNPRLAEDFINHPFKYSLRFFDKNVKKLDDAKKANEVIRQNLVDKHKVEMESFRSQQLRVKEDVVTRQKESTSAVRELATDTKEKLAREGQFRIDDVAQSTQQKLQGQREAFSQKLDTEIGHTIQVAEKIRQQDGVLVGDAIEGIVAIDPSAGIRVGNVMKNINDVLRLGARQGWFNLKDGEIVPVTSGQKQLVARINRVIGDIQALKTPSGNVPLEVLQGLKNDTRRIAQRAYQSGDNATGKIFSDLSQELNPASIVSKDPVLSKKMSTLAEANKKFAAQIKPYNDLISLTTKQDANGNVVTDLNGVVSAVKNNNMQVVNRLRKIDASLPQEDRILPKIKSHISDVDKAATEQTAVLKQTKREVSDAIKRHTQRSREQMKNLQARQRSDSFKISEDQRVATIQESQKRTEELRQLEKMIDDELTFVHDQNTLRSFFSQSALLSITQRAMFYPGVSLVLGGKALSSPQAIGGGLAALGAASAMSPFAQAKAIQMYLRAQQAAQPVMAAASRAGGGNLAQRIVASKQAEQ
jgi:hypothetical protein